ncbi:MAG TPA: hypothetical protein VLG37_04930 [Candidatus Saccharimonadales bacterium]|nr:hypothetical protein [Candidatus Saccharimonadales bacterium]
MSDETAEQLMEIYDKWNTRASRERFLGRMKHKLNAKERYSHYRYH